MQFDGAQKLPLVILLATTLLLRVQVCAIPLCKLLLYNAVLPIWLVRSQSTTAPFRQFAERTVVSAMSKRTFLSRAPPSLSFSAHYVRSVMFRTSFVCLCSPVGERTIRKSTRNSRPLSLQRTADSRFCLYENVCVCAASTSYIHTHAHIWSWPTTASITLEDSDAHCNTITFIIGI